MKKFYILIILLFLPILLIFMSACRDTCNKKMGDTFSDIKWKNYTYSSGLDKYVVGFDIKVLDALSVDYLRTASQEPIDYSTVDSIAFPDVNQMNIYIAKSSVPLKDESVSFKFKMKMDDRRDFTNCVHPGGPDKYEISVSFTINNNNETIIVDNIFWNENVIKGAI